MKTSSATMRLVVVVLLAACALAALGMSASMYAETPEIHRDGKAPIIAGIVAIILVVALLCVVAGRNSMEFCGQLIGRLFK